MRCRQLHSVVRRVGVVAVTLGNDRAVDDIDRAPAARAGIGARPSVGEDPGAEVRRWGRPGRCCSAAQMSPLARVAARHTLPRLPARIAIEDTIGEGEIVTAVAAGEARHRRRLPVRRVQTSQCRDTSRSTAPAMSARGPCRRHPGRRFAPLPANPCSVAAVDSVKRVEVVAALEEDHGACRRNHAGRCDPP